MTRRSCFQWGTSSSRVPGIHIGSTLVSEVHNSSGEGGVGGGGRRGGGGEGGSFSQIR